MQQPYRFVCACEFPGQHSQKLSDMQFKLFPQIVFASCTRQRSLLGCRFARHTYRLPNCSRHFRMSSSLKDLQCIAVGTQEDWSETKAVMPLTHWTGRLQIHHIFLPTDERCWQSCAARGRPRVSYREKHRSAPVEHTAAQFRPWHRPGNYPCTVPRQGTYQGD